MKVSLIATVYNEEDSIESLIESVIDQTRTPDEFVLVDGGSKDGTQEILSNYTEEYDWIRTHVEPGCNISEGRNKAIELAKHDYILGTDGGCVLDERWVEEMVKKFKEGHEALTGLWKPKYETKFELVQGKIRGSYIEEGKIPEDFPPSGKSIGFTREVWQEAGKFPEDLYTGEDSKFASNVRKADYEWQIVEDAWVEWEMRTSWKAYWNQFYGYGEGDGEANNLLDYPGKIFGISKVLLRVSSTLIALAGIPLAFVDPIFLLLIPLGMLPQYFTKIGALRKSVEEAGRSAVLLWLVMIPFESIAHTSGYFSAKKEKIIVKAIRKTTSIKN